jgi:hypothetical protein
MNMTNKNKVVIAWMVIIVFIVSVLETFALMGVYDGGMTMFQSHLMVYGVTIGIATTILVVTWAVLTLNRY